MTRRARCQSAPRSRGTVGAVTALPFDPRHYYTVAEFAALPEDTSYRYELQEGTIVVSPRPSYDHMIVSGELYRQLRPQLPGNLAVAQELDLDLQLATPRVRVPDLMVVSKSGAHRNSMIRASDVALCIEIISPGSVDLDSKIKPMEYADAGIPNFWLIDPRPPVTATIYRLIDADYEESQRAEHRFAVMEPCELSVDLDALLSD